MASAAVTVHVADMPAFRRVVLAAQEVLREVDIEWIREHPNTDLWERVPTQSPGRACCRIGRAEPTEGGHAMSTPIILSRPRMKLKACTAMGPCRNCGKVVVCDMIHLSGKHDRVVCSYGCAKDLEAKRRPCP